MICQILLTCSLAIYTFIVRNQQRKRNIGEKRGRIKETKEKEEKKKKEKEEEVEGRGGRRGGKRE